MLPLSHTSHWSLHFMKNVKNRGEKKKNKTQRPSDTSLCTHKTISQAFMPASRSPRHRVWSSILVVPTAQQLNPDGCQGEILLSLCTRFTDLSPRARIPANGRKGGMEEETVNSELMSSLVIFVWFFFPPDRNGSKRPSLVQFWALRIRTPSAEACQWVSGAHVHEDILLLTTQFMQSCPFQRAWLKASLPAFFDLAHLVTAS